MSIVKLPVGVEVDGKPVFEAPLAQTGGDAEKVYKSPVSSASLYSWFGRTIAVSLHSLGGVPVSEPFIKNSMESGEIPTIIQAISLFDVGSLIVQIQRECWQDIIKDQQIICKWCGKDITTDVDLKKLQVPEPTGELIKEIIVKLPEVYEIDGHGIEAFEGFKGYKYNHLIFRVPTLADALRHERISDDDILFWQKIAMDCLKGFFYEEGEEKEFVPEGYATRRGMLLFNKDFSTKTLKAIRDRLQAGLPSVKFYYEGECPCPRKRIIPYFTEVSNFFS